MITRFFIYGILGWIIEIIWTGMGSAWSGQWRLEGHTYLWMFPIYGLAVFLEPVHEAMRHRRWFNRGMVWLALIWLTEYAAGWAIRALVGICPWDYSGKTPFSVNGLIRLDYAPVWIAAGFLFEKVHDRLKLLTYRKRKSR